MSFIETYENSCLLKAKAYFGRYKEITVSDFKGNTYIHFNDNSKCVGPNGYDVTKSKGVTFNIEEISLISTMLDKIMEYNSKLQKQYEHTKSPEDKINQLPLLNENLAPSIVKTSLEANKTNTSDESSLESVELYDGCGEMYFAMPLDFKVLPSGSEHNQWYVCYLLS
ncbi:hypothetical protein ACF0H5_001593 [Mactra antiquata]